MSGEQEIITCDNPEDPETSTKVTRSQIWNSFMVKKGDKNVSSCNKCKREISTSNGSTGGMWNHLKTCDSPQWKKLDEERQKEKKKKRPSNQSEITSFVAKQPYPKSGKKYKQLIRALVDFQVSCGVPFAIVDHPKFRKLLSTLDPMFHCPYRKEFTGDVTAVFEEMKGQLKDQLKNAGKLSLTADVWTKPGMTHSFLGVTAHWYCRKANKRMKACLAVINVYPPLTGARCYECLRTVLEEFEIPTSQISFTITDNGSNMVAAFKHEIQMVFEYKLLERKEDEVETIEMEDIVFNRRNPNESNRKIVAPEWGIESSDDESDEEEENAEKQEENITECIGVDELKDFDESEDDMSAELALLKRLGCFAHILQRAVSAIDESHLFEEVNPLLLS